MSWPYVAQDQGGGWYGDCEGLMQNSDNSRSQIEAMQWCIDRLAYKLGQARHGCLGFPCLLHQENFDDDTVAQMRQQMHDEGVSDILPNWTDSRMIRRYESFMNQQIGRRNR